MAELLQEKAHRRKANLRRLVKDPIVQMSAETFDGGVWWLGFNTAHCFDLLPGIHWTPTDGEGQYRDLNYVKKECSKLAAQLHDLSLS
jgi:hypothetical protein